jgi:DNA-binding response OmpR family regulator
MKGYEILVVDDDGAHRDLIEGYLGLAGLTVRQASGGKEALEAMRTCVPDLVLLDVQMPDVDGLDVLRSMRSRSSTRDVPVLLLSSLGQAHVRVRGLELGADDFISKTCGPAELLARVRAGLRRGQRYQHIQHALAGNLEDMGLEVLLQTLQVGMKAAEVVLADVGATLLVADGAIRSCRYLRFEGADALERVLLVGGRGRFFVRRLDGEEVSGDPLNLVGAVLAVDEARHQLGSSLAANPLLSLSEQPALDPEIERLRKTFPIMALDLLVAMAGPIGANAAVLVAAAQEGRVAPTGAL